MYSPHNSPNNVFVSVRFWGSLGGGEGGTVGRLKERGEGAGDSRETKGEGKKGGPRRGVGGEKAERRLKEKRLRIERGKGWDRGGVEGKRRAGARESKEQKSEGDKARERESNSDTPRRAKTKEEKAPEKDH